MIYGSAYSTMDAISMVMTLVKDALNFSRGNVALVLDVKNAFNSLADVGIPGYFANLVGN